MPLTSDLGTSIPSITEAVLAKSVTDLIKLVSTVMGNCFGRLGGCEKREERM